MASGSKKVRLKNIADEAGVSVSAVSMALSDSPQISDETKRKVRDISQRLGYVSRRSVKRGKADRSGRDQKRLGFLAIGKRLEDETLTSFLHSLADQGMRQRVRVEIAAFDSVESNLSAIEDYINGVDGVLFYGLVTPQLAALVQRHRLPTVALGPVPPGSRDGRGPGLHCVMGDMVGMGRVATSWLLSQGHESVAFIAGPAPAGMYNACWYDGYRLAQLDAHRPLRADLVRLAASAGDTVDVQVRALHGLAKRPTAFVIPDMHRALGFFEALQALNWKVSPRAVVLGGRTAYGERFGLADCPVITEDTEQLVAAAIELLLQHDQSDTLSQVDVLVPFVTANLA